MYNESVKLINRASVRYDYLDLITFFSKEI